MSALALMQGDAGGDRLVGTDGSDDISGKGGQDRLFDDVSNDDVCGGDWGDRGPGDDEITGIDDPFFVLDRGADLVTPNRESLYVGVPGSISLAQGGVGPDLSSFDTRAEAERAEADGLLRQIR